MVDEQTVTPEEATAIINDEVKNEPVADQGPQPAPLNSKVTSGLGNPFEGTSWG